ncbi:MAG: glycoside hydrolase family 2 protein, partial [Oscillospiraceae bacterium]
MSTQAPKWYNFSIIEQNKEKGHNLAIPHASREDVLSQGGEYKRSLNGEWKFHHQFGTAFMPEGFAAAGLDDSEWGTLPVPSVWQLHGYGKPVYLAASFPSAVGVELDKVPDIDDTQNEVGIYRRSFTLPAGWAGRNTFIVFGAAKAALRVFVNGQEVGYSQGSMTPAEFDITAFLAEGENQLTAVVYRYSDGSYFEDQDMWFLSGIYREVYLYSEPKARLRDFYFTTEPNDTFTSAAANLALCLQNRGGEPAALVVGAELCRGEERISLGRLQTTLAPGAEATEHLAAVIEAPVLWSAEKPELYTLVLTVAQQNGSVEYKAVHHGIKRVEIQNGIFMVNGQKVKLKGTNRHDFGPDNGWALPKDTYLEDVLLMKRH